MGESSSCFVGWGKRKINRKDDFPLWLQGEVIHSNYYCSHIT